MATINMSSGPKKIDGAATMGKKPVAARPRAAAPKSPGGGMSKGGGAAASVGRAMTSHPAPAPTPGAANEAMHATHSAQPSQGPAMKHGAFGAFGNGVIHGACGMTHGTAGHVEPDGDEGIPASITADGDGDEIPTRVEK